MERLFEQSVDYANNRKHFGETIINFQLVVSKIGDTKIRLESVRSLLYQAAWKRSQGRNILAQAALAKLSIGEN